METRAALSVTLSAADTSLNHNESNNINLTHNPDVVTEENSVDIWIGMVKLTRLSPASTPMDSPPSRDNVVSFTMKKAISSCFRTCGRRREKTPPFSLASPFIH